VNNLIVKIILPLGIVALGFGVYGLLHAMKPEPEKKDEPPRALSVFVQPVTSSNIPLKVTTQGEVRARTEVDIVAQVAGRVVEVSPEFVEGGVVEPGVPLIVIEPTDYEFAVHQAEARVAEAQARLKAAMADLEQARTNLERTRITLAFHGRVISTSVDIGQYVIPGTPIGRAFGHDVVEIRLPLNDSQLASLGLPIGFVAAEGEGLAVDVTARVAGREQQWMGELRRLDAAIDPGSRMIFGIAEVRNPYSTGVSDFGMPLAVGLFVNAEISGLETLGARF